MHDSRCTTTCLHAELCYVVTEGFSAAPAGPARASAAAAAAERAAARGAPAPALAGIVVDTVGVEGFEASGDAEAPGHAIPGVSKFGRKGKFLH